jgi:hypothetical protein
VPQREVVWRFDVVGRGEGAKASEGRDVAVKILEENEVRIILGF